MTVVCEGGSLGLFTLETSLNIRPRSRDETPRSWNENTTIDPEKYKNLRLRTE